jgi:hypothetical protein
MTRAAATTAPQGRRLSGDAGWLLVLGVLSAALYLPNLNDYFLGDDFDLIHSFYGKPPRYFLELLWSNESGDVWKSWGIDPDLGRGYLRPLKIWLLKLDFVLWHTNAVGFHLTSTFFFAGNVLVVFAILRRLVAERPLLAFAGAWTVAVHPVFSEVVPFLTAREELVATAFGLGSFLAFLRFRLLGRSPAACHVLYGLALLSKESSIAFPALWLGWDLVHGRLLAREKAERRELLRAYGPAVLLLCVYFALRLAAFGNLVGGDGQPTHYLSFAAFLAFHAQFFRSLFDPTLFWLGGAPGVALVAAGLAALATLFAARSRSKLPPGRLRELLFLGPIWYLASTATLFGTYFAVRHHLLPVIGLVLFGAVLLDSLLSAGVLRRAGACALALVAAATALFLPPTLATSREYRTASAVVARMRAEIEARSAGLPEGSTLSLVGVPQWTLPPFFFGWGLLSSLGKPFTESDLARKSTVINRRNLELTRARTPIPQRYDLLIEFDPRDWVPRELEQRQLRRQARESGWTGGDEGFRLRRRTPAPSTGGSWGPPLPGSPSGRVRTRGSPW